MPRKISARTLSGLLGSYLERFPKEFTEKTARCGAEEGSEVVGLLAPRDAWKLLRLAEKRRSEEWLRRCDADTLRRLIGAEGAEPAPETEVGELQAAAIGMVRPVEAAG